MKAEKNVLFYERTSRTRRLQVALNMAADPAQISAERGTVLASTHMDREGEKVTGTIALRPAEGLIIDIDSSSVAEYRKNNSASS